MTYPDPIRTIHAPEHDAETYCDKRSAFLDQLASKYKRRKAEGIVEEPPAPAVLPVEEPVGATVKDSLEVQPEPDVKRCDCGCGKPLTRPHAKKYATYECMIKKRTEISREAHRAKIGPRPPCPCCGKMFEHYGRGQCCSAHCTFKLRAAKKLETERKWRAAHPTPPKQKECHICKAAFVRKGKQRRRTCSDECFTADLKKRAHDKYRAEKAKIDARRRVAAKKRYEAEVKNAAPSVCSVCGKEFLNATLRRRPQCSDACRYECKKRRERATTEKRREEMAALRAK